MFNFVSLKHLCIMHGHVFVMQKKKNIPMVVSGQGEKSEDNMDHDSHFDTR